MKTPLWTLLLLSLCVPGRSDCQGDCLTCGLLLPQQQAFSTLMCLMECDAQASPGLTRDLCYQALGLNPAGPAGQEVTMSKRENEIDEAEPLAVVSMEDGGMEFSEALERFRHTAQALASSNDPTLNSGSEVEDVEQAEALDAEEDQDDKNVIDLTKRFGGFIKGRHGFRKLVSSGRPLQKRYGGFIGIRKSARKWNNQKRVSQLLRQYLNLTSRSGRSGRFNSLSTTTIRQKNEV